MKETEYMEKKLEYNDKIEKSVLEKFKINLNKNKKNFEIANSIDINVTKKIIDIDILTDIIDKYKQVDFINLDKNFVIFYKGDPYITIHLLIQSFLNRSKIVLAQDDYMIAINEILFTIFNETLKEFKITDLIKRCKYDKDEIIKIKESTNAEVIGIGDTTMYQLLGEEAIFYPYYNIMMYCDNDSVESIRDAILIYSNENHIETEIVYEEDVDKAIDYINMVDTSNIVVLLSNNEKNISKFKEKINKKLLINENPFINPYGKIYKYIK